MGNEVMSLYQTQSNQPKYIIIWCLDLNSVEFSSLYDSDHRESMFM